MEKLNIGEESKQDDNEGTPALDQVLLAALSHPRDRFLLLRAEVEMEQFVKSPACVFSLSPFRLAPTDTSSPAALLDFPSPLLTSSPP